MPPGNRLGWRHLASLWCDLPERFGLYRTYYNRRRHRRSKAASGKGQVLREADFGQFKSRVWNADEADS
jgi:hypothetical protein